MPHILATSNHRDADIRIASELSDLVTVANKCSSFVLTGSYSIDALTSANVEHNDIDVNIFTRDITLALDGLATLLRVRTKGVEITKQTEDRLEYLQAHKYGSTQVEIQFVRYNKVSHGANRLDFTLPHNDIINHEVIVPTVRSTLVEANGHEHTFTVKSLPFAIGTWALRITGVALDQKRKVRESDVSHFALLTTLPHDRAATLNAIRYHPQMPDGYSAGDILDTSYQILTRSKKS